MTKNSILNQNTLLTLTHFSLLGWGKNSHTQNINIYIEGDGQSWLDPWTISQDPTPPDPVAFRIAQSDSRHDSIIYFARPCQYVSDKRCTPLDWTSHRFGPRIIQTYNEALNEIKKTWHAKTFSLHGYSGGATVALLIAAQRNDIISVVTFAPLLDPLEWTKHHRYSPLTGSLSPITYKKELKHIPQVHFFGQEDTEVPYALSAPYFLAVPESPLNTSHKVPKFTHHSDWPGFWRAYILKGK